MKIEIKIPNLFQTDLVRKFFLLFSFSLFYSVLFAQPQIPPVREFDFNYGSSDGSDWTLKIRQTSDGGYISVGFAYSTSLGKTVPSILKINNLGQPQWHRTLDNTNNQGTSSVPVGTTTDGGAFNDVIETPKGFIAVGYLQRPADGLDPRSLVVVQFGLDGSYVVEQIYTLTATSIGTRTYPAAIKQAPTGGYVISGMTDANHAGVTTTANVGNRQFDFLVMEIDSHLVSGTIKWKKIVGETSSPTVAIPLHSWNAHDFLIDNISGTNYSIYIVGGKFNSIISNTTTLTNNNTPPDNFVAGSLSVEKTSVFLDRVDVTGTTFVDHTGFPMTYDLVAGTNYTALTNTPFKAGASATSSASPSSIRFFANTHNDNGYTIAKNTLNSNQFIILAEVNHFLRYNNNFFTHNLYGVTNSGTNTVPDFPTGFDDYKEADLVLFKTDLSGNFVSGSGKQVLHAGGGDFQEGFGQDANGNIYVSSSCADDSKPTTDAIDNLTTRWANQNSAHVIKTDNSFSRLWEFTQTGHPAPGATRNPYECTFSLALNDEGGFVIAGNNDTRDDDYFIHKYYTDCDLNQTYSSGWVDKTIASSTTISGPATYQVKGKLLIKAGTNVTFSNLTLQFANSRHINDFANMANTTIDPTGIYVEAGATLTLTNCTLKGITNCNGGTGMWDGIVLMGTPGSVFTGDQGKLVVTNTTVQDAVVGIDADGVYTGGANTSSTWGACDAYSAAHLSEPNDDWVTYKQTYLSAAKGGGIVQASGSTFLNCRKGVGFAAYPSNYNFSTFTDCIFNNNNYMAEASARHVGLNQHLSMYSVNGVVIKGCTFKVDDAFYTNYTADKLGMGISDFNGVYVVDKDASANATTFKNLTTAVDHAGDGSSYANLISRSAAITNCQNGYNLRSTFGDVVKDGTFTIPPYSSSYPNYAVGVFTDGALLFTLCNNSFLGAGYNGGSTDARVGSYIQSSGTLNGSNTVSSIMSSVLNNQYYGIAYGIQTSKNNQGLYIRENTFNNNLAAMGINTNCVSGVADGGITKDQYPADNTEHLPNNHFQSTCSFFLNYNILLGSHYLTTHFNYASLQSGTDIVNTSCSGSWNSTSCGVNIGTNASLSISVPGTYNTNMSTSTTCTEVINTCPGCKKDQVLIDPTLVTAKDRFNKIQEMMAPAADGTRDIPRESKLTNVVKYLENFHDWDAQQLLVPAYMQLGEYDHMFATLGEIQLNTDDSREFVQLYSLIGKAKASGRDYSQLNDNEWSQLRYLAKGDKTMAASVSKNLLYWHKNEYYPLVPNQPKIDHKSNEEAQNVLLSLDNRMALYPNPNTGDAFITYLIDNSGPAELLITDILGNIVRNYALQDNSTEIKLNTSSLAAGAYFCTLWQSAHKLAVVKMIRQ